MSVYRDTDQSPVTFSHPIGTPLYLTVTDSTGATVDSSADPISPSSGVYTYLVPWSLTQYDAKYTITWTGSNNGFSRKQTFEVVTPLVSISSLRTIFTDTNPTDTELAELENTVRVSIERYCGQSFGWALGPRFYIGNGSGRLILKERCNRLIGILGVYGGYASDFVADDSSTNLNGELNTERVGILEDGWAALINFPTYLDIKQSPPIELIDSAPSQDGTIRVPRRLTRRYDSGNHYTLTAEWGYDAVPSAVQEAAMLLANDYAGNEVTYRDRYLEILKIQQDSFTYHPAAFRGTGNARADALLGGYRRTTGMIVI